LNGLVSLTLGYLQKRQRFISDLRTALLTIT